MASPLKLPGTVLQFSKLEPASLFFWLFDDERLLGFKTASESSSEYFVPIDPGRKESFRIFDAAQWIQGEHVMLIADAELCCSSKILPPGSLKGADAFGMVVAGEEGSKLCVYTGDRLAYVDLASGAIGSQKPDRGLILPEWSIRRRIGTDQFETLAEHEAGKV